jgi:membrane-associated phospholipid phosphatase
MRSVALGTILVLIVLTQTGFSDPETTSAFVNEQFLSDEFKLSEVPAVRIEEDRQADFGDTSLSAFPKTLGRNFAGLLDRGNLVPLMAGISASTMSRGLDNDVHGYFANKDRFGTADNIGEFLGSAPFVAGATGALFVASRFSNSNRFRAFGYSMAQGYIMTNTITTAIKYTADRTRPDGSNELSFLSGHTSSAFTFAGIVNHYYGKKLGIAAYMGAAFVATTRVAKNVHYLSDVVAGAALGYIVGRTVVRGPSLDSQRILWAPTISPSGKGAGISAIIRF